MLEGKIPEWRQLLARNWLQYVVASYQSRGSSTSLSKSMEISGNYPVRVQMTLHSISMFGRTGMSASSVRNINLAVVFLHKFWIFSGINTTAVFYRHVPWHRTLTMSTKIEYLLERIIDGLNHLCLN